MSTFAATECVMGRESLNMKFGLDSCAQSTRNSLINTGNEILIKGVQDYVSYCLGYIDTVISVPDYKLKKVSLRVYVDPLSSMCLLSCNFMKQHRINLIDFMGEKCEAIKEFLLEEDSKVLINSDFEPGNKITVHFDV
uniref:Arp2/3 complex 34 kDa subunit n=1 Tax=Strongyloides venezuelensis TaxID=75913 RepID=A0A0K0FD61_STRVS